MEDQVERTGHGPVLVCNTDFDLADEEPRPLANSSPSSANLSPSFASLSPSFRCLGSLLRKLCTVELIRQLPEDAQKKLATMVGLVTYPAGSLVFQQGDPGEHCYIILSGQVGVFEKLGRDHGGDIPEAGIGRDDERTNIDDSPPLYDTTMIPEEGLGIEDELTNIEETAQLNDKTMLGKRVAVLGREKVFGELALMSGEARSATVKCLEDCEFLSLTRAVFAEVFEAEVQKSVNEKLDFLQCHLAGMKQLKFFRGVHPCYHFEKKLFRNGHVFLHQGCKEELALFVVFKGSVEFCYTLMPEPRTDGKPSVSELGSTSAPSGLPVLMAGASVARRRLVPVGLETLRNCASTGSLERARSGNSKGVLAVQHRLGTVLVGGVFGSAGLHSAGLAEDVLGRSQDCGGDMSLAEPFTVSVSSPHCEVFLALGANTLTKLTRGVLGAVREHLGQVRALHFQRLETMLSAPTLQQNRTRSTPQLLAVSPKYGPRLVVKPATPPPPPPPALPWKVNAAGAAGNRGGNGRGSVLRGGLAKPVHRQMPSAIIVGSS